MQPYYADERVTIYHADVREVLHILPKVRTIITDPPYGETQLKWDTWVDGWPGMMRSLSDELWSFGTFRMFMEKAVEFTGWKYAQDVIWEKQNGSGFTKDRFRRVHEFAVHWYQGKWSALKRQTPVVHVEERPGRTHATRRAQPQHTGEVRSDRYDYVGTRLMRSVIPVRNCHSKATHPTEKPVGIIRPLVQYSLSAGEIMLDPFMGSGTTLLVAIQHGCRAIGIDSDESHCEQTVKRLKQQELTFALDTNKNS